MIPKFQIQAFLYAIFYLLLSIKYLLYVRIFVVLYVCVSIKSFIPESISLFCVYNIRRILLRMDDLLHTIGSVPHISQFDTETY